MTDAILTVEEFEAAATEACSVSLEVGSAAVARIRAHDAAQRAVVEELTRERDELRAECAHLAAHQCMASYVDHGGSQRCRFEDERDALRDRLLAETAQDPTLGMPSRGTCSTETGTPTLPDALRVSGDTVEAAVGSSLPSGPAPTPPAAEVSEVEALAEELRSLHSNQMWTQSFTIPSVDSWLEVARYILHREAALRGEIASMKEALETTRRWLDQARYRATMLENDAIHNDRCLEAYSRALSKATHSLGIDDECGDTFMDVSGEIDKQLSALRERAEKAEAEVEHLSDPERERLIAAVVESCDCSNDCECDAAKLARYERARRAKEKP